MKKSLLWLGIVMMSSTAVFAQKANVSKASNMLYQEPVDYAKAQEYIEMAKIDSTTAKEAKTWYVAGRIGYSMVNAEINKMYLNQQPDNEAMYKGLDMMYANYVQADKYDGVLDKKGKIKYKERKNIKADFKEMLDYYLKAGLSMYEIRDYAKAYTMWNEYTLIAKLDMFADEKKPVVDDSTFYQIEYFAAMAASYNQQNEDAIRLAKDVIAANCKESSGAYEILSNTYLAQNDNENYLASLQEAFAKYPENPFFIGSIINYYAMEGKTADALKYIDQEIARNPSNIEYIIVKAELLSRQMQKFDEARAVLQQALDIDPNNEKAIYVMANLYNSEGIYILEKAEDLNINEYEKERKRSLETMSKALEYFEQLRKTMSPDNELRESVLQVMRGIYLRLEQTDKYQEVNAELQAM
jgi:tetratricopeptide (TPR) repeat protein